MTRLTDKFIKSIKSTAKDQFLSDGLGLYLRVSPAGSRTWVYRYKNDSGTTRWLDLGPYPARSLAEARAEASAVKLKRREGVDPQQERERLEAARQATLAAEAEEQAARLARLTVHDLFEKWMVLEIAKRKDGGSSTRRMFEKDILSVIGALAIQDVKKGHIAAIVDNVQLRGGNGRMAAVVLAAMRQMFRFAVERDYIEGDPTATIRKHRIHTPTERDRVLSEDEVQQLFQKLPEAQLTPSSQLAIQALLATCCRAGELTKAHFSDVDLEAGIWRIPPENSKNKKAHTVALSAFALQIFANLKARAVELDSEWVLPARNKQGPLCITSLADQVGDRQRPGLAPMSRRSPYVNALVLPGGKWTLHDLRRTGATLMAQLNVRPDVIDRCLNHTEQDRMKRIYQRYPYQDEMREAWKLLGAHLQRLTSPS